MEVKLLAGPAEVVAGSELGCGGTAAGNREAGPLGANKTGLNIGDAIGVGSGMPY